MSDLASAILDKLEREHRGRSRAIRREDLLDWIQQRFDPGMSDREMRKIKQANPRICSCRLGYYIAENPKEMKMAANYLKQKGISLITESGAIEGAYPEFRGQLELF